MTEEKIRGHFEEQIEVNKVCKMEKEEAVKDMGSLVEVGISLNRIHRPQIAWDMVFLLHKKIHPIEKKALGVGYTRINLK